MKILILGGYGFIGSYITTTLHKQGHTVAIAGRDICYSKLKFPFLDAVKIDFSGDITYDYWIQLLADYDLVINTIGILQDKPKIIKKIHTDNPKILFKACEHSKTKLIHISALGADYSAETEYASSKKDAEIELSKYEFDWVVLRPSLVYAKGSFGGTSLLRGFASLPLIPIIGDGSHVFEPIAMSDLVTVISNIIDNNFYTRTCFDITGPEKLNTKEIITKLKSWLGFGQSKFISLPIAMCKFFCKIGDRFQLSPFNSTSLNMILYGNTSNNREFTSKFNVQPMSMDTALWNELSTVQDRWHAKLYFYRVLLKIVLALFWISSGILPYFNKSETLGLLSNTGLHSVLILPSFYMSTIWDMMLGLGLLVSEKMKLILSLQIMTVILYTALITVTLPSLWLDPFGSIIKNIPIIVLIFSLFLLSEER